MTDNELLKALDKIKKYNDVAKDYIMEECRERKLKSEEELNKIDKMWKKAKYLDRDDEGKIKFSLKNIMKIIWRFTLSNDTIDFYNKERYLSKKEKINEIGFPNGGNLAMKTLRIWLIFLIINAAVSYPSIFFTRGTGKIIEKNEDNFGSIKLKYEYTLNEKKYIGNKIRMAKIPFAYSNDDKIESEKNKIELVDIKVGDNVDVYHSFWNKHFTVLLQGIRREFWLLINIIILASLLNKFIYYRDIGWFVLINLEYILTTIN